MRVLIVDDEPLARARLRRLLAEHPDVLVVGEADHVAKAEAALASEPELVFLDIEMPGESGLSWAKRLRQLAVPPAIIFTTAHPGHALEAFASSPIDYLVKPIEPERLTQALARAAQPTRAQQSHEPRLNIQIGRQQRVVSASDIIAALSEDKYTRLITVEGDLLLEQSLKELEGLFGDYLLRLHRHSLINRARLRAITRNASGQHLADVTGLPEPLEISRRAMPAVREALGSVD
ncbi:LytR/AlgR family response regulator transcription factor [Halothiobacillus sp.]|jgi:two-component system response regulator AlgR|uniref:LytR/AlgR family response regulator transcription factor n=1 Tax=Halothiobacillus sp. TaxID=1891311 RepID=UPI00298520E9|nr:LytTR family DNA-binding domain-containing protein [Halothiobacillus sp.]MDY0146590.1 LytTR family DNA-binding domain-containing protein [Halothiobacillus sp.]